MENRAGRPLRAQFIDDSTHLDHADKGAAVGAWLRRQWSRTLGTPGDRRPGIRHESALHRLTMAVGWSILPGMDCHYGFIAIT